MLCNLEMAFNETNPSFDKIKVEVARPNSENLYYAKLRKTKSRIFELATWVEANASVYFPQHYHLLPEKFHASDAQEIWSFKLPGNEYAYLALKEFGMYENESTGLFYTNNAVLGFACKN